MEEGAVIFYGGLFLIFVALVVLKRYVQRWWEEWRDWQDYMEYVDEHSNVLPDTTVGSFIQQTAPEPVVPLLHAAQWAAFLNNQPDQVPHIWIVGPTGGGKTSFATALLGSRGGSALVLTPKLKTSDWAGATVVSVDNSGLYGPIDHAFEILEEEKRRRIVALRSGHFLPPLTVVLDELPELVSECKAAGPFVRRLGSTGREIGIRVVALAQYNSVKAGGIEGHGGARANYAWVELRAAQPRQPREGMLRWGEHQYVLDLADVPALAARSQLHGWLLPQLEQDEQPLQADATVFVGAATAFDSDDDLLLRNAAAPESARTSSPQQQITQQHNWADIARLIEAGATSQTKALSALGYKASGTNPRYAAARDALQAALAELKEKVEAA